MNGYERIVAMLEGRPTDSLPLMPITMMFAADQIGAPYGRYAADYRTLVEGQLRTAERFDFDYVSCISDPAREAADCGATIHYFENQPPAIDEVRSLLADKKTLAGLNVPDPLAGGRMHDRVQAAAWFRQQIGGQRLIEGWIEGPCAEAADLRGINRLMLDFYDDPAFVRDMKSDPAPGSVLDLPFLPLVMRFAGIHQMNHERPLAIQLTRRVDDPRYQDSALFRYLDRPRSWVMMSEAEKAAARAELGEEFRERAVRYVVVYKKFYEPEDLPAVREILSGLGLTVVVDDEIYLVSRRDRLP
jgi:hypothetical protein